jgi:hypothetical protein
MIDTTVLDSSLSRSEFKPAGRDNFRIRGFLESRMNKDQACACYRSAEYRLISSGKKVFG